MFLSTINSLHSHMLPINKEFDEISKIFMDSYKCNEVCISSIFKIQNEYVEKQFDELKKKMTQKNGNIPEVLTVFHGTSLDSASNIIETGFDISFSRIAAFGKGTYCSPSVRTALQYCKDVKKNEESMIFLCHFLKGKYGYKNNQNLIDINLYDYSGNNHDIYVTPYTFGIIPKYLICYYKWK